MWNIDETGVDFASVKEAFLQLRARAQQSIAAADELGRDIRAMQVRLRDDDGRTLFHGSLEEAARLHIDGRIYVDTG